MSKAGGKEIRISGSVTERTPLSSLNRLCSTITPVAQGSSALACVVSFVENGYVPFEAVDGTLEVVPV